MFFDTGSYVGFEFINWAKLAGQEALAILLCRHPQGWDHTTTNAMPGSLSFFFFFLNCGFWELNSSLHDSMAWVLLTKHFLLSLLLKFS